MIYEIRSKGDLLSGASLEVRIPEAELDRKALYTIIEDKPEFLLPFSYKSVDGFVEIEYRIGRRCKLRHIAGERSREDYAEMWSGLLSPLLDCGDWFLTPYSFVLDIGYLYCDKAGSTVSYVYIPSVKNCSDYCALKEMAAEFSRHITVADTDIENRVLRAIMTGFNPKAFLSMPELCPAAAREPSDLQQLPAPQYGSYAGRALPVSAREPAVPATAENLVPEPVGRMPQGAPPYLPGDIIIDIPENRGVAKKARRTGRKAVGTLSEKKKERQKARGNTGVFFANKHAARQAQPAEAAYQPMPAARDTAREPIYTPAAAYTPSAGNADITQSLSYRTEGAGFRLIGSASLPPRIEVALAEGGIFTVGRSDNAYGGQRSNFEFERMTKAVSRRHAAIERHAGGYSLIDLASSAGTFLDGQRLPPNTSCELQPGCRVSFGNCGAEYVWEQ